MVKSDRDCLCQFFAIASTAIYCDISYMDGFAAGGLKVEMLESNIQNDENARLLISDTEKLLPHSITIISNQNRAIKADELSTLSATLPLKG